MAVFPSDSIRTKNWGTEILTDSDLETQLDLLHAYFTASLNATTGHAHDGTSNQGPLITTLGTLTTILKEDKGADVASAAGNIVLGDDGNFFDITGTAAITSITIKPTGTMVTLQTDSTASLVDGGNLKLAGTFQGAAESTITLRSDGTNWFEVSRSPAYTPSASTALSGSIIQSVLTQSSAVAEDAGTAVDDDTIPTVTECPIITALNTAITASSASNTLIITATLNISQEDTMAIGVAAIFLDSGSDALAATRFLPSSTNNSAITVTIQFKVNPADTSAHTYKLGLGGVNGTITLNGENGGRKFGGVCYSSLRIDEVKA